MLFHLSREAKQKDEHANIFFLIILFRLLTCLQSFSHFVFFFLNSFFWLHMLTTEEKLIVLVAVTAAFSCNCEW